MPKVSRIVLLSCKQFGFGKHGRSGSRIKSPLEYVKKVEALHCRPSPSKSEESFSAGCNSHLILKGTNGGVTYIGTIASALGGMTVGFTYFLTLLLLGVSADAQWTIVVTGTLCGFVGSCVDSVFGATLQFSGINDVTKKVVSSPGPDVKKISGMNLLDNHMVNALTCFIMAVTAPTIEYVVERTLL